MYPKVRDSKENLKLWNPMFNSGVHHVHEAYLDKGIAIYRMTKKLLLGHME